MASRSPTLRASSDPFGVDAEKDVHPLQDPERPGDGLSNVDPSMREKRSSIWRRQSGNQEVDPFGDEDEEGGVKYRTLKWW